MTRATSTREDGCARFMGRWSRALAIRFVQFVGPRGGDAILDVGSGDAQRLRFVDGRFDRTQSLLALNFVADPARALDEMVRVTRRGGTIAAAVWDYGGDMRMLRIFWDEATALNPAAGARDERHLPLCRPGVLGALWRNRRLAETCEAAITIQTSFSSFEDYWSPFLEGEGAAGGYVATLAPDERDALRLRLRRRLLGEGADGPIGLDARAWAVRGRRAS
jgi:SAM-dependent methyltransferase